MTDPHTTPETDPVPATRLLARREDERMPSELMGRIASGVVALGCFALLATAAWLEPSAEGHGTHEQLPGLEPCGFLHTTGIPCASCGMTTSWAHAAEGDYLHSFLTQPLGMVLALITSMVFWLSLHVAFTGSRIANAASEMMSTKIVWWGLGALLGAWAYKIVAMSL